MNKTSSQYQSLVWQTLTVPAVAFILAYAFPQINSTWSQSKFQEGFSQADVAGLGCAYLGIISVVVLGLRMVTSSINLQTKLNPERVFLPFLAVNLLIFNYCTNNVLKHFMSPQSLWSTLCLSLSGFLIVVWIIGFLTSSGSHVDVDADVASVRADQGD
jgi:hypothetical protein